MKNKSKSEALFYRRFWRVCFWSAALQATQKGRTWVV